MAGQAPGTSFAVLLAAMRNLLAIGFVWLCCAAAWVVLGSTIVYRTGESSGHLNHEVQALWGPPRTQSPPAAAWRENKKVKELVTNYDAQGRPLVASIEREQWVDHPVALSRSNVSVRLRLEHRRKGLLWFPTYEVEFQGRYAFHNDDTQSQRINLSFPLEKGDVVHDGFKVLDGQGRWVETSLENNEAGWSDSFAPDETREYEISYRSRGMSVWRYGLPNRGLTGTAGRARDFLLRVETNFPDVDFPAGSLSPSTQQRIAGGWRGSWKFDSIVTTSSIAIELPQKLNPGPLASRITFFAPVGLLFFFFVVALFAGVRGLNIHPMNYFFFGCAFFAFHLLFAYLLDHVPVLPAFALSSAVSVFLVITYARLFVGWNFALLEMGLSQLVYLVVFSFTFFWEGFTGLAITIGAILTLFLMMQVTGRHDWRKASVPIAART